jgi:hypothetical protein
LGIDNDRRFLDLGRKYYPEYADNILEKDARDETNFRLDNDLVIIRKPQIFGSNLEEISRGEVIPDWDKILNNSIKSIKQDGILLITATTKQEIEAVLKHVRSSNPEMNTILEGRDFDHIDFLIPGTIGNEDNFATVLTRTTNPG